jgi:hypothetical protein
VKNEKRSNFIMLGPSRKPDCFVSHPRHGCFEAGTVSLLSVVHAMSCNLHVLFVIRPSICRLNSMAQGITKFFVSTACEILGVFDRQVCLDAGANMPQGLQTTQVMHRRDFILHQKHTRYFGTLVSSPFLSVDFDAEQSSQELLADLSSSSTSPLAYRTRMANVTAAINRFAGLLKETRFPKYTVRRKSNSCSR